MIDIHTHILPGMDDGAKNVDEALALISLLKSQGVTQAVLTPHFYSYKESLSEFLDRRNQSYQSISDSNFDMILASETYLTESLFSNDCIDPLKISSTEYLLLELPFIDKWGQDVFKQITRLIAKYNIRPIIAHVEKYEQVKDKKETVLQELVDLGCLLQFNIDSVINKKTRSSTLKLMRGGWADYVGSDCHSLDERPPQFDGFKEIVQKRLDPSYIDGWNL